jgi:hypothetical protein
MSTVLATAKAILEADTGTLVPLATGGIWDWDETGRMGINRSNTLTAAAFDATSRIIKPCLLLKLASSTPFGDVADDSAKVVSVREVLEVWGYQHTGYSTIKSMLDRAYTLLQGERLGGFKCRFAQKVQPSVRDIEMDASVEYDRYAAIGLKR